ncbi:hypothetical protein, partial [Micromonospora sp. NPDC005367]|uniref:hypothetical protein n=1 Tax=Micromonospora sp. NPDC005367 TaxID=3155590 RepID=UPI0033AA1B96
MTGGTGPPASNTAQREVRYRPQISCRSRRSNKCQGEAVADPLAEPDHPEPARRPATDASRDQLNPRSRPTAQTPAQVVCPHPHAEGRSSVAQSDKPSVNRRQLLQASAVGAAAVAGVGALPAAAAAAPP